MVIFGSGVRSSLQRALPALLAIAALPASAAVSGIQALHHDGQTFVTWMDAETGTAGTKYRYTLYRAAAPITQANLAGARQVATNILPFSGKRFGYAFNMTDRADPTKPMAVIQEGGSPLPLWSGLAVYTAQAGESAYYAVVARDTTSGTDQPVVAGQNATTAPVAESVAPLRPIQLHTAASVYPSLGITGRQGLPLLLVLHASGANGGPPDERSDYYEFFGNGAMGYHDGLQTALGVQEWRLPAGNMLRLFTRDTLVHPSGAQGFETYWFGYNIVPEGAPAGTPARAQPYTENRLDWMLQWTVDHYGADTNRLYAEGQSMGGWGTLSYALRRPTRFAALYPAMPRTRQTVLPNLDPGTAGNITKASGANPLMPDNTTRYFDRMDSVAYVAARHADLPFIGWSIGRNDGYATWQEQVDFVHALQASRHGFAFAWNNGDHSAGTEPMVLVKQDYPPELFALNKSYPALTHSSLDNNLGNGDPANGDLVGGINLGFAWSDIVDQPRQWSVRLSNRLATARMTVDVTPRRLQQFTLNPGDQVSWTNSAGGSGVATVDAWNLVTIPAVGINPGQASVLTLSKDSAADTTAPTAPSGLRATAASASQVNLSWTASTDNLAVTGYRVLRNGTPVATVTATSHSDTGLAAATAYSYTVQALDAAGNVSAPSAAATATTSAPASMPTTTTPEPPAGGSAPSSGASSPSASPAGGSGSAEGQAAAAGGCTIDPQGHDAGLVLLLAAATLVRSRKSVRAARAKT